MRWHEPEKPDPEFLGWFTDESNGGVSLSIQVYRSGTIGLFEGSEQVFIDRSDLPILLRAIAVALVDNSTPEMSEQQCSPEHP